MDYSLIIPYSLSVNILSSKEVRLLDSDSSPTFGIMDILQKLFHKSLRNHKVRCLSYSRHIESTYELRTNQLWLTSEAVLAKTTRFAENINLVDQILWILWKPEIGHGPKRFSSHRFRELGVWYFAGVAWGGLSNHTLCNMCCGIMDQWVRWSGYVTEANSGLLGQKWEGVIGTHGLDRRWLLVYCPCGHSFRIAIQ
jgi:hypothetical protein